MKEENIKVEERQPSDKEIIEDLKRTLDNERNYTAIICTERDNYRNERDFLRELIINYLKFNYEKEK